MEKTKIKVLILLVKIVGIFEISEVLSQDIEDIDYLNFSVIANPQVRYYAKDYNRLCPYSEMCDVQVPVDPSVFWNSGMSMGEQCCGACKCGNDCLNTLDCCPDRLPRLPTSDEVKSVYDKPVQCVHAQFRSYNQKRYNGKSYSMIANCAADFFDEDVIENCLREYEDFDFVKDIPNFLPVTDLAKNSTYKNKYCAKCNHALESNLVYWEAEVGIFDQEVNIQRLEDIQDLFKMDSASNVVFKIPKQLFWTPAADHIELCDFYIDKCNVTGLWDVRNETLESLCVSYLSRYKEYKNIHCYLCNGFPESTIEQICDGGSTTSGWRPKSYISLLDFNDLEPDSGASEGLQDSGADISCEDDQQFDAWTGICRNLHCSAPLFLNHNKCRPSFTTLSQADFDFTLRLIPVKGYIDIRIIENLKKYLETDIQIGNDLDFLADQVYTDVQMFVKMNDSLSEWLDELATREQSSIYKEHVQYIAVRFIISASEVYNVTAFMTEVKEHLLAQNFDITGGFHVEFANISFLLYNEKLLTLHSSSTTTSTSPPADVPILPYEPQEYGFFDPFDDPVDNHAILPIEPYYPFPYPNAIRVMPFLFCPYIILSEEEFTIQAGRNEVYLIDKQSYINTTTVVFSENDSTISLCIRNYFSPTANKNIGKKSSLHVEYDTEVILSIVCTSVSMLCLVIVLVTYSIFSSLRTLPGLNNMGLSLSLLLAQLLYLLGGVIEITADWLCKTLGILLHFSLLNSYFWMLVCTFHMMRTFVFISKLTAPENKISKFVKYTVFVILASALLVVVNIVISVLDKSTIGYGSVTCYISSRHMILYTVAIPLGVIVLSNLIMFVYVMIKVCTLPEVSKSTNNDRNNMVIFAKLSTLTGITWLFAYLYQWTELKAFSYMFILANALQGLFIMFSFIANRRVFNMITTSYRSSSLYQTTQRSKLSSRNGDTQGKLPSIESNHM